MSAKPLGVWQAYTDAPRPPWASFAALLDWANFDDAARQSVETGIRWVLLLYGQPLDQPLGAHLAAVERRLHFSGLRPYVQAICYWEEAYGALKGGRVDLPAWQSVDRDLGKLVPLFRDHVSRQHAAIKAMLPEIPICWVDAYVNNDPSFGPWFYQPLPDHVDLVALEGYVPANGSWAADVEPFLQHSLTQTDKPIILVPQGFQAPADPMWQRGPTAESIAGVARWMAHPRVVAGWLFDWASPPASHGVVGMADLPLRAEMLRALGVR